MDLLEKVPGLFTRLNRFVGLGYKLLIPTFSFLLIRSYYPTLFLSLQTFSTEQHWDAKLHTWLSLSAILISLANTIGVILTAAWFGWSILLGLIRVWRERVELNWSRAGSYALGWLILSSSWWWVYYAISSLIQPSAIGPISAYSGWLYGPVLVVSIIWFIRYVFFA